MPRLTVTDTMPQNVQMFCRDANTDGGLLAAEAAMLSPETIAAVNITQVFSGKPTLHSGWSVDRWDLTRIDGTQETLYIAGEGNPDGSSYYVHRTAKSARAMVDHF